MHAAMAPDTAPSTRPASPPVLREYGPLAASRGPVRVDGIQSNPAALEGLPGMSCKSMVPD